MNVEDFISTVLIQIQSSTKIASSNKVEYCLDNIESKGVHFDLAISASQESSKAKGAKGKVGIRVLEAGVDSESVASEKAESVSRIKFNVVGCVPNRQNKRLRN
jgi:hypothetical protein